MNIIKIILVMFVACASSISSAHESSDPIKVVCGLANTIIEYPNGKMMSQYVTYAISPKLLKDHFDLKNGRLGGYKNTYMTDIPIVVVIKTSEGRSKRTGTVLVFFEPTKAGGGAVTVETGRLNQLFNIFDIRDIHTEYSDEDAYKKSMTNEIESCELIP